MRVKIMSLAAVLLLISFAGLATAADTLGDDAKAELKKLQGTWELVSGEVDGKKVADEDAKQSKITWNGNKVSLVTPHQSKEKILGTITKIDLTKNSKEMHWVRSNGPKAGTTMVAIYEFEGGDQYKICFDPSGKSSPKEFATKEGTGHIRHTWKRVK